ncbi:hypothetical protein CONLIGDRAFT_107065 [Coniochaeta ligniaria NRRL 30616]|uniref:Uncharacterized protein n=1 Tax=Coniochaeta ligniaria NRRL 30616 TaxID=1408157 RepID=A0A1J7I3Z1_9PEZI|nr:hypothetical protein CONLIGDRAFT_107065 [Coniochaeta ligniaria NRRL 30616]
MVLEGDLTHGWWRWCFGPSLCFFFSLLSFFGMFPVLTTHLQRVAALVEMLPGSTVPADLSRLSDEDMAVIKLIKMLAPERLMPKTSQLAATNNSNNNNNSDLPAQSRQQQVVPNPTLPGQPVDDLPFRPAQGQQEQQQQAYQQHQQQQYHQPQKHHEHQQQQQQHQQQQHQQQYQPQQQQQQQQPQQHQYQQHQQHQQYQQQQHQQHHQQYQHQHPAPAAAAAATAAANPDNTPNPTLQDRATSRPAVQPHDGFVPQAPEPGRPRARHGDEGAFG